MKILKSKNKINFAAIIVAGGSGKRFGSKEPKQFLRLNGRKMFEWSITAFRHIKECIQIILVVPEYKTAELAKYKKIYGVDITAGGKERFDSVKNGIKSLKYNVDYIAVHDAARPLITSELIKKVFDAAKKSCGAIAAVKEKDTVKFSKNGKIIAKSINRDFIWHAQTPQIFKADIFKKVYSKKISKNTTDDSQLFEKNGRKIVLTDCGYENFKVTQPVDFYTAEFILKQRKKKCL